jgi:hypothetical protein
MSFFYRVPPCPGDPRDYILVKRKGKWHWRLKRGLNKPARLNYTMQSNSDDSRTVSPAGSRIQRVLEPYFNGIKKGHLFNRMMPQLRRSFKEKSCIDLKYLKDVECQEDHRFRDMLLDPYSFVVDEKNVRIEIPIGEGAVKQTGTLVTDFYFQAILLYGDPSIENGLRSRSIESPLFPIDLEKKTKCIMKMKLPKEDNWVLLLKINSLEGNQMAANPKHYRMKFVG